MIAFYGDGTNVGDEVIFNDELFYVIDYDNSTDKVTLIPRYTLNVSGSEYVQDPNDTLNYYSTNVVQFDAGNNRNDEYCTEYSWGGGCNVYSANQYVSKDSTIKGYVDNYKTQLVSKGMIKDTDNVRLITLNDLEKLGYNVGDRTSPVTSPGTMPYFMYNTATYWTGDARSSSTCDVWILVREGELTYEAASANWVGFRPVIEVKRGEIIRKNKKNRYATWIWKRSLDKILASNNNMNQSIKMLKNVGINEVYLSISPDNIENQSSIDYISKLNNSGIKVYALYGDPAYILPANYDSAINTNIRAIANFNSDHFSVAHIDGIHYDVEYYLLKENNVRVCPDGETEEARNCGTRKQYVDFIKASYAKAKEYNLYIGHDITAYTTNMATYYDDSVLHNVFDDIVDYSDSFIIMAYGNSSKNSLYSIKFSGTFNHESGGTLEVDKSIMQKLNEHNKEVIVGQELDVYRITAQELADDPSTASTRFPEYYENGKTTYKYTWDFINQVFNEIESYLYTSGAKNVSFAIHDYKQLEELLNK